MRLFLLINRAIVRCGQPIAVSWVAHM